MDLYKPYIQRKNSFASRRQSISSQQHLRQRTTQRNTSSNKHETFIYKMMTQRLREQVQTLNQKINIIQRQRPDYVHNDRQQLVQSIEVYKKITQDLQNKVTKLVNTQQKLCEELSYQLDQNEIKNNRIHELQKQKRNLEQKLLKQPKRSPLYQINNVKQQYL